MPCTLYIILLKCSRLPNIFEVIGSIWHVINLFRATPLIVHNNDATYQIIYIFTLQNLRYKVSMDIVCIYIVLGLSLFTK